jgi:HAD superfamily hydrolase (TIGR01509 family)
MPPSVGRIRVVLFDLGGTLVDERDFTGWTDVAHEVGLDFVPDDLVHAYGEVETAVDLDPLALERAAAVVEFWRRVLARASARDVDSARASDFLARARSARAGRTLPLFSDARRCLARLKQERRRLGVISNSSSEEAVRAILRDVGILDSFEVVVSSGTEGVAKPDPEIFRRAVARMGVRPEEALYVGNLLRTDAHGAVSAGLHAAWLNRGGTGFSGEPNEITSLLELPLVVHAADRGETIPGAEAGSHR